MGGGTLGAEPAALECVLAALGPRELARVARTCASLREMAHREALWAPLRARLWVDKAHVAQDALRLARQGRHRLAYAESLADAGREVLTHEELVGTTWSFRFTRQAGAAWTARDPFWRGGPAARVRFAEDGTVVPLGAGVERAIHARVTWRFLPARPGKPRGALVRCGVNGRDVPTYVVSRHANWGFVLQSCWAVYTSFEMPPPGADDALEDENLPVTVEQQWREVLAYNRAVALVDDDPLALVEAADAGGAAEAAGGGRGEGADEERDEVTLRDGDRVYVVPRALGGSIEAALRVNNSSGDLSGASVGSGLGAGGGSSSETVPELVCGEDDMAVE